MPSRSTGSEAGHVDGGDVLRIGRRLHVGLSSRTDEAGLRALAEAVAPLGYDVVPVPVAGGLHLKSAATSVAGVLVHNPDWVSAAHFAGAEPVAVAPGEAHGGNVLLAGETLLAAADSPRTAESAGRARLRRRHAQHIRDAQGRRGPDLHEPDQRPIGLSQPV